MNSTLPFAGIRVVALEQAVSAPFCSRQFADMGADVIKIERLDGGDFARNYDGALNGVSAYFAWLNRGKRSVTLNLKDAHDLAICTQLIAQADIFIHNFAPGAVERLGLDYANLQALNPRLIWCGISGYGADGPYRDKKAYDLLIQTESGVVSLTGTVVLMHPLKRASQLRIFLLDSMPIPLFRPRFFNANAPNTALGLIFRCSIASPNG